jgi:CubicO group peptidase (beta-lactamase class C family)
MFTAAALVSLAEEGRLKLEGPIGSYVPGLHESIAALTPHQLLTHTAGLTDESVMTGLHDDSALAAGIRKMDGSWLFTQPGRLHSYSNPGYWIAGLVSEQVAGKPYADVLEERLFRPLGMSRTTLRPTAAMTWPLALGHEVRRGSPAIIRPQADNAATWPAGQMYSSVEELARFVIALMHEGQLEGRQVLSPTLIERLTQPYVPRPGTSDHYGYGLAIGKRHGATIVSHGGSRAGYGSTIQMAPEHKAAVIILANRSGSSLPRTAVKALELLLPASAGDVKAAESTTAEKPTSLSEAEMASLAGIYTNRRQTIELTVREGKLTMRRRGGEGNEQGTPLQKAGDSRLTTSSTSGGGTLLHIVRDENGNPEYLCSGGRAFKRQPAASGESSSGL